MTVPGANGLLLALAVLLAAGADDVSAAVVEDLSPIIFPSDDGEAGGPAGPAGAWAGGRACPPLRARTVDAACRAPGQRRPGPCDRPQPPGTVATLRCKALHTHHALPASAYASRCADNGAWSVRLFSCSPVCGRPTGKGIGFVRNGQNVSSSADYPWHVAVYDKKEAGATSSAPTQICGGSLIKSKFFVSAAHCFHTQYGQLRPVTDFAVAAGKRYRAWDRAEDSEQRRTIERVIINGYGDRKLLYVNDIALVEVEEDFTINANVLPICIDWRRAQPPLADGALGVVVGYGGERKKPLETLQYARLPYVKEEVCKQNVSEKFVVYTVLEDKFCVGTANGSSVGPGDSGGGIAFATPDRQWFLKGVVSVGDASAVAISLATNVSQFISWMSGITNDGTCGEYSPPRDPTRLGESAEGHMPWSVRVRVDDGGGGWRELSGALVQPNVVLTCEYKQQSSSIQDGMRLLNATPYAGNDSGSVQTIAPASIHVTWATGDGSRLRSDVHRIHVHERSYGAWPQHAWDVALLELKDPFPAMPVCLDTRGVALEPLAKGQLGLIEDWDDFESQEWSLLSAPYLSREECKAKLPGRTANTLTPERYCVGPLNVRLKQGAGFFVRVGEIWYIRGVRGFKVEKKPEYSVITDLTDPGVRFWLQQTVPAV